MSKDGIAQLREFYRIIFEGRHEMASEDVLDRRRQYGGHMVQLDISVVVPVCHVCTGERSFRYVYWELIEVCPWLSPDGWDIDLLLIGMPPDVIDKLKDDIAEGIDSVRGPWCYVCHGWLPYWDTEDAACGVYSLSGKQYFGFDEKDGPHVTQRTKQWIRKLYDHTCFGCQRQLTDDEMTVDHIIAKTRGGTGEELNLQLLCTECNAAKANDPVEVIDITLHFPLRPVPSDSYEGVTW